MPPGTSLDNAAAQTPPHGVTLGDYQQSLTRLRGLTPEKANFGLAASRQATEFMGHVLSSIAEIGCSEDLPHSRGP